MTTVFETEPCSRCSGTGHYSFNGEHSICYKCGGKNGCRNYTKRGRAAKDYYEGLLAIDAKDVKVGEKLRSPGIKQLTVATITRKPPNGRAWVSGVEIALSDTFTFANNAGLSLTVGVDSKVRRIPTAEENEVLLKQALTYQESLTLQGKPRKS